MGISYYLVDDKNKKIFDLGKGYWDFLSECIENNFIQNDPDHFFVMLCEHCLFWESGYLFWLRDRIINFIINAELFVRLITDSSDEHLDLLETYTCENRYWDNPDKIRSAIRHIRDTYDYYVYTDEDGIKYE
jgi:hypothetical protein